MGLPLQKQQSDKELSERRVSLGNNLYPTEDNPSNHHSTIVLRGLGGSLIWSPLCRETPVSQSANASFIFVSTKCEFPHLDRRGLGPDLAPADGLVRRGAGVAAVKLRGRVQKHWEVGAVALQKTVQGFNLHYGEKEVPFREINKLVLIEVPTDFVILIS